jgi:hypothetical protein
MFYVFCVPTAWVCAVSLVEKCLVSGIFVNWANIYWPPVIHSDSKLLSGFPFPINGNPDNNLESFCISQLNNFVLVTAFTPHMFIQCLKSTPDTTSLFEAVSRDSSVGIGIGYELENRGTGIRFPAGARDFSVLHSVQTGSGAHPSSYPISTGGPFFRGKAAWTWPLTSI